MHIFGSTLSVLRYFFAHLPAAYTTALVRWTNIFPSALQSATAQDKLVFQSLNRRLKECVLGRRGDCHCLPVWLCSHNKNTGSKWTTKHPLSGPARLTRIYWATRRNEEEIFLTPTAAKGTERKFNNTLCDQPPHCTGGEPFRHTIFCHYRNLITHFSIFFYSFSSFHLPLLFLYVICLLLGILCVSCVHSTEEGMEDSGWWILRIPQHWASLSRVPSRGVKQPRWSQRVLCVNVRWRTMGKNANITLWYFDCYCYCFPTYTSMWLKKSNTFNQEGV